MVVYVLVAVVAVGLLKPAGLAASGSPLSAALSVTGNSLAVQIISVGGLVATASVLLTAILGISRMAYSMARRNDLPDALSRLHSRFFTPYVAILASGFLMAGLVFVDLKSVVAVSTFALLFTYCIVNISAFKLKENHSRHRILPIFGLATCLMLLTFIFLASPQAWEIGVAFLIAGTIYYAVWKKLKQANKRKGFRLR